MPTATLTSKGQMTIPQSVRTALSLRAGTRVDFVPVAGGFKLVPQRAAAVSLKGRFAGRVTKPVSIADMDEAIALAATSRNAPLKR